MTDEQPPLPPPPLFPMPSTPLVVLVPVKLDAFVLNPAVCNGGIHDAKIAPITQPNYTFLRVDGFVAQNDILPHVDLHLSSPSTTNPRLMNLGTGEIRRRTGVYLHWSIPRAYRRGATTEESAEGEANKPGHQPAIDKAPKFPTVPTRWLVIRRIHKTGKEPPEEFISEFQAWVVESDKPNDINHLGKQVDLEVDVSPFIESGGPEAVKIARQAEVFMGGKTAAELWTEPDEAGKRQPLTVLTSSNPLFADYQPHNSNVFSMLDHFEYGSENKQLTQATASYYVLGWHSSPTSDILNTLPLSPLKGRLKDHLMTLDASYDENASARTLCHGAMYHVEWNANKKPQNVAADKYSRQLNSPTSVAVGTTVVDALLAFIQAQAPDGEKKETASEYSIASLEADIWRIHALLLARDDGVDGQREAADMLNHHNYDRVQCGTFFHIAGTDTTENKETPRLSEEKIRQLAELNQVQYALDLTTRAVRKMRWDLFSLWWKYVSSKANGDKDHQPHDPRLVDALSKQLAALVSSIDILTKDVEVKKEAAGAKPAAMPNAYQQRDPTLLVPGIKSGWPHDFMDLLKVRLQEQIMTAGVDVHQQDPLDGRSALQEIINKALPTDLQDAGSALADEFLFLSPSNKGRPAKPAGVPPLYHDPDPIATADAISVPETHQGEELLRDQWQNRQPWFPLFLEWEVEYTHTLKESWNLKERPASGLMSTQKLRYGLTEDHWPDKRDGGSDSRRFSGRTLILPQPKFSLKSRIQELFDTTPLTVLDEHLPQADRVKLLGNIDKLPLMSALLTGFTDHLVTRAPGTHIKPNVRVPGQKPQAINDIVGEDGGAATGFTTDSLGLIGRESDLTPYGTMVKPDKAYPLFKPVTHGRFKFTKINIIDKFGQAIHALNPIRPTTTTEIDHPCLAHTLYPCVGEFYSCPFPPSLDDANKPMLSEYVYVSPQINQFARLNSCFVVEDDSPGGSGWRPTTEWDTDETNPIWGWVIVNAPDNGIQLFLADGTFYRAVRVGGSAGTSASAKWLPNDPPARLDAAPKQLERLVQMLADLDYLNAFIGMIDEATRNGTSAPTAYSQFVSSLVGKPFALANMGWSLELAVDAYTNQATLDDKTPEPGLLGGLDTDYEFGIKFGDQDQVYDGLAGYFKVDGTKRELDLKHFYTYQRKSPVDDATPPASNPQPDCLVAIGPDNYPKFHAYWVSPYHVTVPGKNITIKRPPAEVTIERPPATLTIIRPPRYITTISSPADITIISSPTEITISSPEDITIISSPTEITINSPKEITISPPEDITIIRSPADINSERNAKLQVFGAILDPFTAVHAYSSFLPTTALQLPPFTWQSAMSKMTAFFHLGPLLVPTDITASKSSGNANKVPIPAMGLAEWRWLQPCVDVDGKETTMDLEIETLDQRPRFEEAPYMAIEGYLKLVAPLSALDVEKQPES